MLVSLYYKIKQMNTNIKIGDKFNYQFTTPFGKEVSEVITVVAIRNNSVMMSNGSTFHLMQLNK